MTNRLLFLALLMALSTVSAREPYRPGDDSEVLLTLAGREDPAMADLWAARAAMREAPGELIPALRFARRSIEAARQLADPRYMSYAEAALAPWNDADPPNEVRVMRATLAQHRHQFDAALADLDAVLTDDPRHAQARLTRAVIRKVRGAPQDALRDCAGLVGAASSLVVATCVADSASLSRQPTSALALLLAEIERAPQAPTGERLWALTVRAEIAERLGWPETEGFYREALALGSVERPDPYLLNAYADFLLETGRPADARALLLAHVAMDDALLRLAVAETRLLDAQPDLKPDLEDHRAQLETRFEMSQRRGDAPHQRELARFLLDVKGDAAAALPVALANWSAQREPADALLVIDAAITAGQPEAAAPVHDWLQRTGLEDVRVARRLADS